MKSSSASKSRVKIALLGVLVLLAGCSNSSTNAQKVVVSEKSVKIASLEQKPSEISINVSGKVTRSGEVYLLRGLANVFSRGMDTLGAKMVRKGLDARVYNHTAWRELADNILERSKKKKVSYPIIIMGHSLGANASTTMAKYLGDRGVKVQYVVTFDPTVTTFVGKNVNRVVNFYLPKQDNRNVVKRTPDFKGVVKNINVRGIRNITHTSIEKDPVFHSQILKRIHRYTKRLRRTRS